MSEPQPEFSRPFALERLGSQVVTESLIADAGERAALARRLGLMDLPSLRAEITVGWQAGDTLLALDGWLEAEVVQRCVVTLEPVPQTLREPIHLRYARAPAAADEDAEESFDPDAPEPLPEQGLDLGEEVAQALSLALDPYPRAPGASLPPEAEQTLDSPFAKLRELKDRH